MDLGTDIWNQVAVEASQLYFEDEFGNKKSRFADTVIQFFVFILAYIVPLLSCCLTVSHHFIRISSYAHLLYLLSHCTCTCTFFFQKIIINISSLSFLIHKNKIFLDYWETAGQGAAQYLLVFVTSGNMSDGKSLQTLAANRLRYAFVEECIVASGGLRSSCRIARILVGADFGAIWTNIEIYRVANWADYAHGVAWVGSQVSQFNAYVVGFLYWYDLNVFESFRFWLIAFPLAMQLHDFSEMQSFPAKLKYMCICLSEVIFMEGFMRKIYNFINGLEVNFLQISHTRDIIDESHGRSFTWSEPMKRWRKKKKRSMK